MRSLIHPSSPRRALFGSGVVRSIVALWVVGAVVLVAAWLGAPAAQAQSRSDVRFWTAQLEYEAGHYRQAFDMFAALADEGHCESARIARAMRSYGPKLYAMVFDAPRERAARWPAPAICASDVAEPPSAP